MKTAYISCPMTIPQYKLDEVIKVVAESGAYPKWWPKGSSYEEGYYTGLIQHCDAFIVMLPDMVWHRPFHKMTSGSRKELQIAVDAKKPIYLAYKRNEKSNVYAADVTDTCITGIASTKFNFRSDMIDRSLNAEVMPSKKQDFDVKKFTEIYNQIDIWLLNTKEELFLYEEVTISNSFMDKRILLFI